VRRAVAFAAVLVAALAAATPPAVAHTPKPVTRSCGQVNFTPNSDDLAANVQATGLTCGLARDFVRDSRGRPGASFRGFRCTRTPGPPDSLPYTRFRCTGAGDVIRWRRF